MFVSVDVSLDSPNVLGLVRVEWLSYQPQFCHITIQGRQRSTTERWSSRILHWSRRPGTNLPIISEPTEARPKYVYPFSK